MISRAITARAHTPCCCRMRGICHQNIRQSGRLPSRGGSQLISGSQFVTFWAGVLMVLEAFEMVYCMYFSDWALGSWTACLGTRDFWTGPWL